MGRKKKILKKLKTAKINYRWEKWFYNNFKLQGVYNESMKFELKMSELYIKYLTTLKNRSNKFV